MNQEMVEVRTIADGFLNYTKATAISLNGIRLLCYLGILCRVALTDHSTRKIPGRYHIYILLIAAADMVLTGNSDLYNRIPGAAAVAGPIQDISKQNPFVRWHVRLCLQEDIALLCWNVESWPERMNLHLDRFWCWELWWPYLQEISWSYGFGRESDAEV